MEKTTRIFAILLYGISAFCIGAEYELKAIYFVLSAIYLCLGILIDKNNGKDR